MKEYEHYTCKDEKMKSYCNGEEWNKLGNSLIKAPFQAADKDKNDALDVDEWISTMVELENIGIIEKTEEPKKDIRDDSEDLQINSNFLN